MSLFASPLTSLKLSATEESTISILLLIDYSLVSKELTDSSQPAVIRFNTYQEMVFGSGSNSTSHKRTSAVNICRESAQINFKSSQNCWRVKLATLGRGDGKLHIKVLLTQV